MEPEMPYFGLQRGPRPRWYEPHPARLRMDRQARLSELLGADLETRGDRLPLNLSGLACVW